MTAGERRSVAALAAVYLIRMLGLFLLLPVLAVYATGLPGSTPTLVGLAMGTYGLAQALLQIPFGRWSDRRGRKPVIVAGLVLFVAGSVLGAAAHDILAIIGARALQGAGAISAAVTALLADQTRDVMRTRAMAVIGAGIGVAFILSLLAAPLLGAWIGVPGIFRIMAGLGVLAILLTLVIVPAEAGRRSRPVPSANLLRVATDPALIPFYASVFALHFILTATFLAVPLVLVESYHVPLAAHWRVYLETFIASLVITLPLVLVSERIHRPARFLLASICMALLSQALLAAEATHWLTLLAGVALFFGAFNFLEAQLPALLSRAAPAGERGAALGVFATAQFAGTFCGGAIGGLLMHRFQLPGVFCGAALVALVWALLAARLDIPAPTGEARRTAP